MKVNEIRAATKKHKKEELIYVILELYKRVPKSKKEDYRLDELISSPKKYKEESKPRSTKKVTRSLGLVEIDFDHFEEHTLNDNYFFPNREISKKERSKWRHHAKAFYNEIILLSEEEENKESCADMMKRLFTAVKTANVRSGDPFRSVGIEENVFFYQVLAQYDPWQDKRLFIDMVLDMALTAYFSIITLMDFLKTPGLKMLTIEKAQALISVNKKKFKKANRNEYYSNERINKLTLIVFHCQAELLEWDDGISFLLLNYINQNKEVKYFILIKELFWLNQIDLIVREMDKAKQKGVKLRDKLWTVYNHIKEHGELPNSLY